MGQFRAGLYKLNWVWCGLNSPKRIRTCIPPWSGTARIPNVPLHRPVCSLQIECNFYCKNIFFEKRKEYRNNKRILCTKNYMLQLNILTFKLSIDYRFCRLNSYQRPLQEHVICPAVGSLRVYDRIWTQCCIIDRWLK